MTADRFRDPRKVQKLGSIISPPVRSFEDQDSGVALDPAVGMAKIN